MKSLISKFGLFFFILIFSLGQLGGCSCIRDSVSPTVQITKPENNSNVSGIVIIQAVANDDVGVAKVEFYIDGEKVGEDTQSLYKYWWDTTNLSYGSTHTIKAKAYDNAGNIGESPAVTVTIGDPNAPEVEITNPADGSTVTGIVTISAEVTDRSKKKAPSGIQKVEFYIDDQLKFVDYNSPYNYDWNTDGLTYASTHTIEVAAYDSEGNMGRDSVYVVVGDSEAPLITITNPVNGSTITGIVTIRAEATDRSREKVPSGIQKVEFYVDGNKIGEDTSSPYEYSWDTDSLQYNSQHTIQAKAYDILGNVGESSEITVTIGDVLAPIVTITNPANGSTVTGVVTIRAEVTDRSGKRAPSGIQKVEFYVDGSKVGEDTSSPYEYNWDTDSLQYNSQHTIQAKAYDTAGNVGESSEITVTIGDVLAPTVRITNPADGSTVPGIVTISAEVTDRSRKRAPSGIQKVEFYIDDQLKFVDYNSPYNYDWNTGGLTYASTHTIKVAAYDSEGNVGIDSIYVVIGDSDAPLITITNPANGSKVTGIVTIRAEATDRGRKKAPSGIQKVEFYVDGSKLGEDISSPYEYSWDTDSLQYNSQHTIQAKAYDTAGKVGESSEITVTIGDESDPTVTITNPTNGAVVTGIETIRAEATDRSKKRAPSGIQKVEFYIDGVKVGEDTSSPYEYNWNTGSLQYNSQHTIQAKAYDNAGKVGESSIVTVTIGDALAPTVTITNPANDDIVSELVIIRVTAEDKTRSGKNKRAPSGIKKVELYINEDKVGESSTVPYEYSWDTVTYENNKYTLKAKAYDIAGNEGESDPISVTVNNPETYRFLREWGSLGSEDGQFNKPRGIAIDLTGNIYVVDYNNHRIQKFDSDGNFITKWGGYGSGNGEFRYPFGIAIDSFGNVYVTDTGNHRIQKFDSDGNFITKWGTYGLGDGEFNTPCGIAIDSFGNVYVADTYNNRIQKFDSDGNFIAKWGTYGSGDGLFDHPFALAVDTLGNVYVADTNNSRIQKFDSNGNFITKWGGYGTGNGQFMFPYGVAVDTIGNVYVVDTENNRIQKFTPNGTFITKWGLWGSESSHFKWPYGVATRLIEDYIYVADTENNRIQQFECIRRTRRK